MIQRILSIETSCDDTSVAVVRHDGFVEGVISAAQDEAHEPFGGIVPEIACRNHTIHLLPLVQRLLSKLALKPEDLDGVVATDRPGLIGSLIVGVVTAKALAQTWGKPYLGVNHLEGHLWAPFLKDDSYAPPAGFTTPAVALAISGGHTSLYRVGGLGDYEILGTTRDDAAGEAFDKFAKMIGLGFPGGVKVDTWAKQGNPAAFAFPRAFIHDDSCEMSFSGLKSAAHRLREQMGEVETLNRRADLCASFQEAVVDVLISKLDRAATVTRLKNVILTGGVSANSRLRARAEEWTMAKGYRLAVPPIRYCTDNAAMTGFAGIQRMNRGEFSKLDSGPSPHSRDGDFKQAGS